MYAKVNDTDIISRYDSDDGEYEYALDVMYSYEVEDRNYSGQDRSFYSYYQENIIEVRNVEFKRNEYIIVFYDPEFASDSLVFKPYSIF